MESCGINARKTKICDGHYSVNHFDQEEIWTPVKIREDLSPLGQPISKKIQTFLTKLNFLRTK